MSSYQYKCYNKGCNFLTNYKGVYESHCVEEHKGKPAYPGIADLELYGWTAQGREWEAPVNRKEGDK